MSETTKRKISVAYEEVIPSKNNTYSTMRFRIGQEYDIEVPNSPVGEMLLVGEFDKASKLVKQAVRYQIKRLQDPSMEVCDAMDAEGTERKLDAMQSQKHSGIIGDVSPHLKPDPFGHNGLDSSKGTNSGSNLPSNTQGKVDMTPAILMALEELERGVK